ncbi:hypothetical protein HMPREF0758_0393 [Serratia odorifera DSM 4582]|uniref:Uncharacterized protein n=1 Tax=Serratia odorifera DSM 4582 TaxID=667129 RepID=D4DWU3_SEROD|nr:hypothetical protein HMPREF0758_0393 [Serratia odorifera DSM 4582]
MIGDHQTAGIVVQTFAIGKMIVQNAKKTRGGQKEAKAMTNGVLRQLVASRTIADRQSQ